MAPSDRSGWRQCLVLIVLLGAMLAQLAQAAAPVLGINAMWGSGDPEQLRERFKKAKSLGVTHVRIDWEWRLAEPQRGTYQWDKLDNLVRVASEEGIELLPIVHYAPTWALVDKTKAGDVFELAPSEDAYQDFGRFVSACIERYGPGGNAPQGLKPIGYWQIWNEPNVKQFWGPEPDADAFVAMMQVVNKETERLRDRVKIVHAGISRADIEYLWELWDNDKDYGRTFDILAVHPYVFDMKEGVREPDAMDKDESKPAAMGFIGSTDDPAFLGKVFNLQLFMNLKGAKDKPIWITEEGYVVADHKLGVTEAEQARRMVATLDYINQHLTQVPFGEGNQALPANVQRVYWFSLEDYPSPDGLGNFGLFRADGSERPAAEIFRHLKQ
ncbi:MULTISPECIES: beta-galactosidase [unclassified Pseudomonas]|uniref:beta-galactosidase n=1 Tax=unclassified Pseudomonas TaxID=196821 RepID=UPI0015B49002|nr:MULTISPECIES: beta-galactosidase [unclassified Pseudomonas]